MRLTRAMQRTTMYPACASDTTVNAPDACSAIANPHVCDPQATTRNHHFAVLATVQYRVRDCAAAAAHKDVLSKPLLRTPRSHLRFIVAPSQPFNSREVRLLLCTCVRQALLPLEFYSLSPSLQSTQHPLPRVPPSWGSNLTLPPQSTHIKR